ncbi:50S ribosomal protein L10 [Candidatus Woesearchaeota archaeon]|nr:50S ribosomal protein L10 [Candidatus Woesearchaeota archaeon]
MKKQRKIQESKLSEVEEIKRLIKKYNVLGIVDMTNLPSLQLQRMRHGLRDILLMRMSKRRIIKIAIEQSKDRENLLNINEKLKGEIALIFTNDNPFKLAKMLEKQKSSAPAKPGQEAPNDLIIPAGPTSFTPGPVIGELGQLGIKTEVKEGKIAIKEDKLLVKQGDIISQKAADLLSKLGIEPMQIGLNLIAAYENGIVYGKDVLVIDEESYINNIKQLAMDSFNLAIHLGYTSKDTIFYLIKKAFKDSKNLAESKNITINEEIKEIVQSEESQVLKNEPDIKIEESSAEEPKLDYIKEDKMKKYDDFKPLKEPKKPTTEEILEQVEEETKEYRENLQKERKEKEAIKMAEDKLRELTDQAIKKKK